MSQKAGYLVGTLPIHGKDLILKKAMWVQECTVNFSDFIQQQQHRL